MADIAHQLSGWQVFGIYITVALSMSVIAGIYGEDEDFLAFAIFWPAVLLLLILCLPFLLCGVALGFGAWVRKRTIPPLGDE